MKKIIFLLLLSSNCMGANLWETVNDGGFGGANTFWRMPVPHGWLIKNTNKSAITFYPDEKHEWKIQ